MAWRYLSKTKVEPGQNPGFINNNGSKVFKSKVIRSWVARLNSGQTKTGFSCAELAKQWVEREEYAEASGR